MKYRLKGKAPTELDAQVCIVCGKRRIVEVVVFPGNIRPDTAPYMGGTGWHWLDCLFGSHEWYFEREVEPIHE